MPAGQEVLSRRVMHNLAPDPRAPVGDASAQPVILETRGLTKSFGPFTVVDGVDLAVRRQTIHALIGPNGAGKTTVFNLLTKFLAPSAGRIFFKGNDITDKSAVDVALLGMVRSFQISAIYPDMSSRENVRMALQRPTGLSMKFWRSERDLQPLERRVDELLDAVGMASYAHWRAGDLPYGRRRALEVATTLALDPEVLLLDEPMAGLAHEDIDKVSELIRTVAKTRTVLMVEHNLSVVAALSDRITVLARGQTLAEGDYATVSADPRVREAYIGSDDEQ
jgi:branched-chain amino acid transport system ATP-binding protein